MNTHIDRHPSDNVYWPVSSWKSHSISRTSPAGVCAWFQKACKRDKRVRATNYSASTHDASSTVYTQFSLPFSSIFGDRKLNNLHKMNLMQWRLKTSAVFPWSASFQPILLFFLICSTSNLWLQPSAVEWPKGDRLSLFPYAEGILHESLPGSPFVWQKKIG